MMIPRGSLGLLAVLAAISDCDAPRAEKSAFNVAAGSIPSAAAGAQIAATRIALAVDQRCVLWSVSSAAATGGPATSREYRGAQPLRRGGPAAFACEAEPGGIFRRITIEGKAYDLDDGRFFLLTRQGETVTVRQLAPDPATLGDARTLEAWAQDEPRVADFFDGDRALEAARFAGEWTLFSTEVDGAETPPEDRPPPELTRLTIRGDRVDFAIVTFHGALGWHGTFRVVEARPRDVKVDVRVVESGVSDLGRVPDRIHLSRQLWRPTPEGRLQCCSPIDPAGERPSAFFTKAGDGRMIFTYERLEK